MQQVKPGSKWTEKELDLLKQRAADGWRWGKIAIELGRSDEAVATKARSLGLTAWDRIRLWTQEEDQALIEMRAKGMQNKDIGEVLNRNRGAIDKRVKHLGLTNPKPLPKVPSTRLDDDESEAPAWRPPERDRMELVKIWNDANQRVRSYQSQEQ